MTPQDFLNLLLQNQRITRAIQSGGQWEVWLQTELGIELQQTYGATGRELKYPNSAESVDLAFTLNNEYYAIELKVESATNAGQFAGMMLVNAAHGDITKLRSLNVGAYPATLQGVTAPVTAFAVQGTMTIPNVHKWVVCVAWSPTGKQKIADLQGLGAVDFVDEEGGIRAALILAANGQWA